MVLNYDKWILQTLFNKYKYIFFSSKHICSSCLGSTFLLCPSLLIIFSVGNIVPEEYIYDLGKSLNVTCSQA